MVKQREAIQEIDVSVLQQVTTEQAWHYLVLPFKSTTNSLSLYTVDSKLSEDLAEELELLFGKTIELTSVEEDWLQQSLSKYYRRSSGHAQSVSQIDTQKVDDAFLEKLIREAQELGSSDIHLEPYEERCRIRFRIDGKMIERYTLEKEQYPGIVNKIKIKASLDITEKRLPQDGRIFFEEGQTKFDIRVSSLPTLHGEKIVMRLLSKDSGGIDIHKLGFDETILRSYLEGVKRPHGMVLISGPTGSGKTTTLYATLEVLNQASRNILTIEDPIEYTLEGINQVQLKEAIGLDFASAMRTFLRQDPDIIMVGEIRDQKTASMAIRASLTGHLVLSTLHTNSAWGIIARLIDMGIPPYLLADTLNTAVAQRLVRLLCNDCKEVAEVDSDIFPHNFEVPSHIDQCYKAKGCANCYYTGYRGRKAVYEVIPIDRELAEYIKTGEINIPDVLSQKGIVSLSDSALQLFAEGQTTMDEIYAILAGGA